MTQKQLNEMTPTEFLNLWSRERAGGEPYYRVQRVGPAGAKVQSFTPPEGEALTKEVWVAKWVHDTITPWLSLLYLLFVEGASVGDVERTMGERMQVYADPQEWDWSRRAKFQRAIGIDYETPKQFGLAVIAAAEKAIAEKLETSPPRLHEMGQDPDVVEDAKRHLRLKRRNDRRRERYREIQGKAS
ncbi:hypothetical protein EON81_16885 [bacterium]|nr:MAG: hypothetical protein EON81_16885 [bacterium]